MDNTSINNQETTYRIKYKSFDAFISAKFPEAENSIHSVQRNKLWRLRQISNVLGINIDIFKSNPLRKNAFFMTPEVSDLFEALLYLADRKYYDLMRKRKSEDIIKSIDISEISGIYCSLIDGLYSIKILSPDDIKNEVAKFVKCTNCPEVYEYVELSDLTQSITDDLKEYYKDYKDYTLSKLGWDNLAQEFQYYLNQTLRKKFWQICNSIVKDYIKSKNKRPDIKKLESLNKKRKEIEQYANQSVNASSLANLINFNEFEELEAYGKDVERIFRKRYIRKDTLRKMKRKKYHLTLNLNKKYISHFGLIGFKKNRHHKFKIKHSKTTKKWIKYKI